MRPVVGEMVMEWFLRKDLVRGEKRREVWMSRVEDGAGEGEGGSDAIVPGVVAGGAIIARRNWRALSVRRKHAADCTQGIKQAGSKFQAWKACRNH